VVTSFSEEHTASFFRIKVEGSEHGGQDDLTVVGQEIRPFWANRNRVHRKEGPY